MESLTSRCRGQPTTFFTPWWRICWRHFNGLVGSTTVGGVEEKNNITMESFSRRGCR